MSDDSRATHLLNNINRDMDTQRNTRRQMDPRSRIFYALFIKIARSYIAVVPKRVRLLLEIIVLLKGLFLFCLLGYVHHSLVGLNCMNETQTRWSGDGVLRVNMLPQTSFESNVYLLSARDQHFNPCHIDLTADKNLCANKFRMVADEYAWRSKQLPNRCLGFNLSDFLHTIDSSVWKNYHSFEYVPKMVTSRVYMEDKNTSWFKEIYQSVLDIKPQNKHVFEYSQEYGLLHLSHKLREKYKVPVLAVQLDPKHAKCLGGRSNKFLLRHLIGYDNVLMTVIKKMANTDKELGYMLNVVTGENYRFVPSTTGRASYFLSFMLMFLFTVTISMLLRYCHQQVFIFIVNMLQVMNMHVISVFPIAPLIAVILSLVGLETIMAEFFNDTTMSFYVILIVWSVDQYDAICCHTHISRKYWLRFFYLYHFVFYAYYYRFNGQFGALALAASWFMVQHSMLYFFHHYELPTVEVDNHAADTYLEDAVQIVVDGIESVIETPPGNNNPPGNNSPHGNTNNPHGNNRVFVFPVDHPLVNSIRDFVRNFNAQQHQAPQIVDAPDSNAREEREDARGDPSLEDPLIGPRDEFVEQRGDVSSGQGGESPIGQRGHFLGEQRENSSGEQRGDSPNNEQNDTLPGVSSSVEQNNTVEQTVDNEQTSDT